MGIYQQLLVPFASPYQFKRNIVDKLVFLFVHFVFNDVRPRCHFDIAETGEVSSRFSKAIFLEPVVGRVIILTKLFQIIFYDLDSLVGSLKCQSFHAVVLIALFETMTKLVLLFDVTHRLDFVLGHIDKAEQEVVNY